MNYGDIFEEAFEAVAFGGVGLVILIMGYGLIDILTPGKLNDLVFKEHNRNASIIVTSGLLSIGLIEAAAILGAEDTLGRGLASAAIYGIAGLVILGVSFLIIDLLTPGSLGEIIVDETHWAAALVTGAAHLAVGGVVAAALS